MVKQRKTGAQRTRGTLVDYPAKSGVPRTLLADMSRADEGKRPLNQD
jgi:hypothetical protein